jgi:hypothetical protein
MMAGAQEDQKQLEKICEMFSLNFSKFPKILVENTSGGISEE